MGVRKKSTITQVPKNVDVKGAGPGGFEGLYVVFRPFLFFTYYICFKSWSSIRLLTQSIKWKSDMPNKRPTYPPISAIKDNEVYSRCSSLNKVLGAKYNSTVP
jgi:hypothetical protein